ncbi:Werner Syndrome-like exonuclease [Papaver somniferum]|uniref:Werner Syndrome-like exonuclease n=1 Tax=Papaver somniferum TaxID=3469 RepID=UPI000E6F7D51|nr:Werner Syndrome-like exonuclease [Papaver somniferum]
MSSTSSADSGKYRRNTKKHTSIQVVDKKAETRHIFKVKYYNDKIHTTVTHTESAVEKWIDDVYKSFVDRLGNLVVGLDIEQVQNNKVDVLQLCVGHKCLIFQFFGCDKDQVPASLVHFLNDHDIKFVGAGIDRVAEKLLVDYGMSISSKSEDLGRLADNKLGTRGLYHAKLNSLVNIVLGEHLHHEPKYTRITFSRWDRDYLKNEQVEHACLDAYASFKLGLYLSLLPSPKETNKAKAICPGAI